MTVEDAVTRKLTKRKENEAKAIASRLLEEYESAVKLSKSHTDDFALDGYHQGLVNGLRRALITILEGK